MQLALNALTTAPAPSPQATPRAAAPATEQAAFSKVLAARQREAKAADTRHSKTAEARAEQSRRHEGARDSGDAGASAESVETAEALQPQPGDETNGAAAALPPDMAAARPAAPTLAELLAALNRAPAQDAGLADEDAAVGAVASAARGARAVAVPPPGARPTPDAPPQTDAMKALVKEANQANEAKQSHEAYEAVAEAIAAGTDPHPARGEAHAETAPAAMTSPLPALHSAPRVEVAAAPHALTLTTPATAPEFREALGVQVSVLARGGVQQAELHLNPAEMGPISVQIALDGTQAQVQFGADSLATRQIIEAGLPELAAALRDAGFTLSGGGVSQHSRGQADGAAAEHSAPDGSGAAHGDAPHSAAAAPRTSLRMPQGAVDLYA